jgi:class 3 adenylate cyclase
VTAILRAFRTILSLTALLGCGAPAHAFTTEAGSFGFKIYPPSAYLASPQNWTGVEDQRGVMYFGNTDGLLEFDGVTWRRIALPNAKAVRSLAINPKGVVYVGGQNELGYLAQDELGAMRFVSLLDKLKPADRAFGDVWSIVATAGGVYFSTTERLLFYDGSKTFRIWRDQRKFRRAFWIDNKLHVQVLNQGLHVVDGESIVPVEGGDEFVKADVRGVFQSAQGLTLATTKGLFVQAGGRYRELQLPVTKALLDASVYSVRQISPDLIAFGTTRGGLIFTDAQGQILRVLVKESGLPSEYISSIQQDRQGGIWLTSNNGIVRFLPRLTYFTEKSGLRGAITSMARWQGRLHVGTTSGLFRLTTTPDATPATFEPVPNMGEPIWSLLPREDRLWVGAQTGLYEYDGKKFEARTANKEVAYEVNFSRKDPNTLFVAMRTAAYVLRFDGKEWTRALEIPSGGEEFRTIVDDENGVLWATTRATIVRVDLNQANPKVQTFTEKDGLPKGWQNAFRVGQRVLFATEKGLIKYDPATNRFVPDGQLGTRFSDGSLGILLIKEDPRNGNLWISGAGYHGLLVRPLQPDAEWQPMPFINGGFEDLWAIHPDADGIVWAAGSDGRLARLEPGLGSSTRRPFEVLMRRLMTSESRQFIYEGIGAKPIEIKADQNSLRFEFAAPFFDAPERVSYQTALDATIDNKTPWSGEAWKDLGNLWDGEHRLRVRARSPYGETSPEVMVVFRVAPPWYRTYWAYSFYSTVLIGLIWLIFRWRLRSLRESNRRLERVVLERTAEIRQQRDQIIEQEKKTESLLLNILPAPVADELRTRGSVAPMKFENVTVCFTDFVGFTLSSEKIPAEELVAKLHEYFTAFDQIITRYGLEKLKTIGDSYMFVSGLPEERDNHAELAVRAALDILGLSKQMALDNPDLKWRLRVGLHSGPVVAGVVGFKKFAFDVWGDTVNLASRMESSGMPDRVNLSERTYELIQDKFECESRGLVKTKDGRDLPMYFANRYRTTLEPSRAMMT